MHRDERTNDGFLVREEAGGEGERSDSVGADPASIDPLTEPSPEILPVGTAPWERARGMIERLKARGVGLVLDPEDQSGICLTRTMTAPILPTEAEWVILKNLKPELLELLAPPRVATAEERAAASARRSEALRPKSAIPAEVQEEVRRLIAGLAENPSAHAPEAFADVLCSAFSSTDRDPASSRSRYARWAKDVVAGRLAPDRLLGAFGSACLPGTKNPGARLVATMKD